MCKNPTPCVKQKERFICVEINRVRDGPSIISSILNRKPSLRHHEADVSSQSLF
jgi:hypothetical protein